MGSGAYAGQELMRAQEQNLWLPDRCSLSYRARPWAGGNGHYYGNRRDGRWGCSCGWIGGAEREARKDWELGPKERGIIN